MKKSSNWRNDRLAAVGHRMTRAEGLLGLVVVGAAMLISGCNTVSGSSENSFFPFGRQVIDKPLREKAEADPFPSAQQAGLAMQKSD